jgi:hypothetical protein
VRLIGERLAGGCRYDLVELRESLALAYAWRRKRNPELPPSVVFSYGLEVLSISSAAWSSIFIPMLAA